MLSSVKELTTCESKDTGLATNSGKYAVFRLCSHDVLAFTHSPDHPGCAHRTPVALVFRHAKSNLLDAVQSQMFELHPFSSPDEPATRFEEI